MYILLIQYLYRGQRDNCTHLTSDRYKKFFVELPQFYNFVPIENLKNIINMLLKKKSNILLLENQEKSEHTIARLRRVMVRRNVMNKRDYISYI
jgi:hypothetical protein